jgi:Tol biopolymer transport system component
MLYKALQCLCYTFILSANTSLIADKGDTLPAEWKTLPALVDGYEVIQLTTAKSMDSKMYLNVNNYVKSVNSVVILSDRNKYQNLYLLSLNNGTLTQLTASKTMDGNHSNVCDATATAFYRENRTIKSVDLTPPYQEKTIYTVPTKYSISGNMFPSADGSKLAVALYEGDKNKSTLAIIDINNPSLKSIQGKTGKIDHVIINRDGNKLLYHIYKENRIGVVDIDRDDEHFINKPGEHGVHPFWFYDSIRAAYVQRSDDNNKYQQIVAYDTEKDSYTKYSMPTYSNHCAINPSSTIVQGDGNANNPYIYYYAISPKSNTLNAVKMFKHNSSFSDELWHPHASFINDTDLIFNSDAGGNSNIYLLRKTTK